MNSSTIASLGSAPSITPEVVVTVGNALALCAGPDDQVGCAGTLGHAVTDKQSYLVGQRTHDQRFCDNFFSAPKTPERTGEKHFVR